MDNSEKKVLTVDDEVALKVFYERLSMEVGFRSEELEAELKFVASILADKCLTSVDGGGVEGGAPLHGDLTGVFDNYIFSSDGIHDPKLMEDAGAQTLLYAGFFRTQQENRHKLSWFNQIGRSFFERAACLTEDENRKAFLLNFSKRFEYWSGICHKLSKTFRDLADDKLVIRLPPKS